MDARTVLSEELTQYASNSINSNQDIRDLALAPEPNPSIVSRPEVLAGDGLEADLLADLGSNHEVDIQVAAEESITGNFVVFDDGVANFGR